MTASTRMNIVLLTICLLFVHVHQLSANTLLFEKDTHCNHPPNTWCSSYEIAKSCNVVQQCEEYLSPDEVNASPVQVNLYMESLCPDCKLFTTSMLYPTWKKINNSAVLNIAVFPYGNAQEHIDGHRWVFECQHGPAECEGNQIMTCAINVLKDTAIWLPYIACIEDKATATTMVQVAQDCASQQGIDYKPIDVCSHNEWGDMLEHHVANKTESLNPPHEYVPWITLNGVHTKEIQHAAETNLLKLVCDTYKGTKPAVCQSLYHNNDRCYRMM